MTSLIFSLPLFLLLSPLQVLFNNVGLHGWLFYVKRGWQTIKQRETVQRTSPSNYRLYKRYIIIYTQTQSLLNHVENHLQLFKMCAGAAPDSEAQLCRVSMLRPRIPA